MKKNWIFFVVLALFILLLVGGSALYKNLSADMEIESLVTAEELPSADTEETAPPEEAVGTDLRTAQRVANQVEHIIELFIAQFRP